MDKCEKCNKETKELYTITNELPPIKPGEDNIKQIQHVCYTCRHEPVK